ncbi:hypothetical protein A994_12226 [Methanobacterium formicicum DSM 3637]|uniref:Uncharacterized protein n=2 Tax=Methanobacterium formicicum TaxID=2162 RepID=K2R0S4_METFP|nr:hypothetical protein A994_12226 [Methanobacterium formicicum DSM 3637]
MNINNNWATIKYNIIHELKSMSSKISSIGLLLLVLIVIVISGCTSQDTVKETVSGDVKHFEGKGISFNAPNTWSLGQM